MKRIFAILLLLTLSAAGTARAQTSTNAPATNAPATNAPATNAPATTQVSVWWDYPTNLVFPTGSVDTTLGFVLSTSSNLALPFTNWTALTNFNVANASARGLDATGTNEVFSLPLALVPGQHFFTLQASNFWGVSAPSAVAWTPPAPATNGLTRITRP